MHTTQDRFGPAAPGISSLRGSPLDNAQWGNIYHFLYTKKAVGHDKQSAGYTSDLFSMVGTIFLWMYWPSFNGATAVHGEAQQRAVLNTYFSLCGSVFASFAMSALLNKENKFVMVSC